MGFRVRQAEGSDQQTVAERFTAWGLEPRSWSNGPGDTYGWHDHSYHKVLFCVRGSITFHLRQAPDVELHAGDRLDIEPHTDHAATVGPEGVECVEASSACPVDGSE